MGNITQLEVLSAEFPVEKVKQRKMSKSSSKMLDYISIDDTINRFNEVLGVDWSVEALGPPMWEYRDGNHQVIVNIRLDAMGKTAYGVGAGENSDLDNASKTALAEAIKKAGHQFGVGLYLWDENKREAIAKSRRNDGKEEKSEETFDF